MQHMVERIEAILGEFFVEFKPLEVIGCEAWAR